jgi:molybdenum cofactor synthesis domain-containing protein
MENERRIMGFNPADLLPPQQAVIAFLARVAMPQPAAQDVPLAQSFGRILATDVRADRAYPVVARSTMDGFAIRAADSPGTLEVIGTVLMGRIWDGTLAAGQAVQIPTGGAVPAGADTVVPVELTTVSGNRVSIAAAVPPRDCITDPGDDMRAGELLLRRGRRIGAAEAAVLATLGLAEVPVYRRPRVGVISSGDELVGVEEAAGPAQVRDSNRYAVAASLAASGAHTVEYPTVADEPGALEAVLRQAVADCDAVFLTGGSSVGDRDHTPRAIAALGEPGVIVHGLRVKPGKPTVLAAIGSKPVIGLPGNPTSALMILEAVMDPVVRALTGNLRKPALLEAVLEENLTGRAGWTWYVPVCLRDDGERYFARPLAIRSSSASLPARADGFVTMEEAVAEITCGATVRVRPLTEGLS